VSAMFLGRDNYSDEDREGGDEGGFHNFKDLPD
jgi:hypothetical protein